MERSEYQPKENLEKSFSNLVLEISKLSDIKDTLDRSLNEEEIKNREIQMKQKKADEEFNRVYVKKNKDSPKRDKEEEEEENAKHNSPIMQHLYQKFGVHFVHFVEKEISN